MSCRWWGPLIIALAASFAAACGGGSSDTSSSGTPTSVPTGTASASSSPAAPVTPSPAGPNGIATLSPADALSKVSAAAAAQQSVRIKGSVAQGKKTLSLDVHAGLTSGQGELHLGGGQVALRLVNGTLYFKGDLKGLAGLGVSKAAAVKAANKWIGGDASTSPLAPFVSITDLVKSILSPDGTVVRGRAATVNGVKTYSFIDKSKSGGVLYVATRGEPLPVQILNGKSREKLSFSEWGAPLSVVAPPKAITVPAPTASVAPSTTPAS